MTPLLCRGRGGRFREDRVLTRLAELELDRSPAWCDLHAECFREIFAPGPGLPLSEALVSYQAWCRARQVWVSAPKFFGRQLARAGYQVRDETILGVPLAGP